MQAVDRADAEIKQVEALQIALKKLEEQANAVVENAINQRFATFRGGPSLSFTDRQDLL